MGSLDPVTGLRGNGRVDGAIWRVFERQGDGWNRDLAAHNAQGLRRRGLQKQGLAPEQSLNAAVHTLLGLSS